MKRTFIPPHYRPYVPGAHLRSNGELKGAEPSGSLHPIVAIAAKEDVIPRAFIRELADSSEPISLLYYDDLGESWDFSFYKGTLCLIMGENKSYPYAIYHRHPGLKRSHSNYLKHIAFLEAIEQWSGNCLGQRHCNFHNSSKMYQMINSVYKARKESGVNEIALPYSFFIKGRTDVVNEKLKHSYIVKSCSSYRSKVASRKEFQKWDKGNIRNLPTLFQEHLKGEDVRVHICDNAYWALKVKNKDYIDYRYATKGSVKYEHIELSFEKKKFCKLLTLVENNLLLGIDFISLGEKYVCLESNPAPGWSTFNHPSKQEFALAVFLKLASKSRFHEIYKENFDD